MERIHKAFEQTQLKLEGIKEEEILTIKQEQRDCDENICANNIPQLDVDVKEISNHEESCFIQKNPLENEQNPGDWEENEEFHIESATSDEYELSDYSECDAILRHNTIKKDKEGEVGNKKSKDQQKCGNKSEREDKPKKKRSSHRLDPLLTEQLIRKHIKMLCDLCIYSGSIFSDIVTHFKENHPDIQPYIMCCNRKFTRSYCIDQHAIIHENPDSFR